jgi:Fur family ferric uptake transcriptional regulator
MTMEHRHTHGGDWSGHALAKLEAAGFKRGGARRAVIEALASAPCAISALDIEEGARDRGRRVGRASVYRALEQLAELGLVHKLDLGSATALYERTEPGGDHHHHMVCDECGKVLPFEDPDLELAVRRVQGSEGFAVREHEIVLHGECDDCR